MGKVTILNSTTKNVYELIGECVGPCYGSDTSNREKNEKRGRQCVADGHGRVLEYPQVYIKFEGYSARVMRELYTHIGGAPTRTQASTRYIKYGNFDYIMPESISRNPAALHSYTTCMNAISDAYRALEGYGIPKEDIANILPLGMTSTVVLRTNPRMLIDMAKQRLCTRAYWEYRQLMKDLMQALSAYSPDWEELVAAQFKCKCDITGYCQEIKTCGKRPLRQDS